VVTDNIHMNSSPIINLYTKESDPIEITSTALDYPVVIDKKAPERYEIYSVNRVHLASGDSEREISYLFSAAERIDLGDPVYFTTRKEIPNSTDGKEYEVYLSIINKGMPSSDSLNYCYVTAECIDRNIPLKLYRNGHKNFVLLDNSIPVSNILPISRFTGVSPIGNYDNKKWLLLAHLSRHYLNITDNEGSLNLVREVLSMYRDFDQTRHKLIAESITAVKLAAKTERLTVGKYNNFCKGILIQISVNDSIIPSGLPYLLAIILEYFFSMYCSINSFIQLEVYSSNDESLLYQGMPRNGVKCLI